MVIWNDLLQLEKLELVGPQWADVLGPMIVDRNELNTETDSNNAEDVFHDFWVAQILDNGLFGRTLWGLCRVPPESMAGLPSKSGRIEPKGMELAACKGPR